MILLVLALMAMNSFEVSAAFNHAQDSEDNAYTLCYDEVRETEEGNFEFILRRQGETAIDATTTLVVPLSEEYYQTLHELVKSRQEMTRAGSHSATTTQVDTSYSFSISLTATAVSNTINGMDYWKLSSVSCTITGASGTSGNYMGSGVYVLIQNLTAGNSGFSPSAGYVQRVGYRTYGGTARSWTYSTPSSWEYVDNQYMCIIGASVAITAQRGASGTGSSWTTTVSANIWNN